MNILQKEDLAATSFANDNSNAAGGVAIRTDAGSAVANAIAAAATPFATPAETITGTSTTTAVNPAGLAAALHGTNLATCPATGPTVAPTSEGHYYYTSTLGEKWIWIYGEAQPFPFAKFYSMSSTGAAATLATGGVSIHASFTMPRAGVVTIVANVTGNYPLTTNNSNAQLTIFAAGVPRQNSYMPMAGISRVVNDEITLTGVTVAAGDVVAIYIANDTSSVQVLTTYVSSYRVCQVTYTG